jgi:hypothetical protein
MRHCQLLKNYITLVPLYLASGVTCRKNLMASPHSNFGIAKIHSTVRLTQSCLPRAATKDKTSLRNGGNWELGTIHRHDTVFLTATSHEMPS